MLKPILIENENLIIHPFRSTDFDRYGQLVDDIYSILSDSQTLKFIPTKRLHNIKEAEHYLNTMIINYHTGKKYLHFITDKNHDKVVGMVDLISPAVAMEHYNITNYPYFIEFYLSSSMTGCYIMTELLPMIVESISRQGITELGAIVNRKNIAARKVLENAQFTYKARFDILQDLYEIQS